MNNSLRIQKFETLKTDPYYSRLIPKLTQKDIGIITTFIIDNDSLGYSDFEFKMNRFFLDRPLERPKNWAIISEILMISNMIHKPITKHWRD